MTRIITALFLKETLAAAANDTEMVIREKMRERQCYVNKLRDVFTAADITGDGQVTLEEFEQFLKDPKVRSYLAALELDTHDSKALFNMLDDGDGNITVEEFVENALRLKGGAKTRDMVSMMDHLRVMQGDMEDLQRRWEDEHVRQQHESNESDT